MRNGSKQRECITEYLRNDYSHPTAHTVYEHVRERFPSVSLGTVYRNLEYLLNAGIIKKVQKAGSVDRYDFVREHHNHALCSKCGKIFDFEYRLDSAELQAAIGDESKFRLSDADFLVVGVCGACAASEENRRRDI